MLKPYPEGFRHMVLDLVAAGRPIAPIAADLRISDQTIYGWRRQAHRHRPARRAQPRRAGRAQDSHGRWPGGNGGGGRWWAAAGGGNGKHTPPPHLRMPLRGSRSATIASTDSALSGLWTKRCTGPSPTGSSVSSEFQEAGAGLNGSRPRSGRPDRCNRWFVIRPQASQSLVDSVKYELYSRLELLAIVVIPQLCGDSMYERKLLGVVLGPLCCKCVQKGRPIADNYAKTCTRRVLGCQAHDVTQKRRR